MNRARFLGALAGYALIALSAAFTLEKELLWAVWVLMGGLAFKSWIALEQGKKNQTNEKQD